MIFYFSGTGNSRGIAEVLAERLDDQAMSIVDQDPKKFHFEKDDYLGFVFPCYAYAAPEMMLQFAEHLNPGDAFTFAVCTFSNVTGDTLEHFSDHLPLKSGYGIKMPDNFPILDKILETKESTLEKLRAAEKRLDEIFPRIQRREAEGFDTLRGEDGHNRSYNLSPQFNALKRKTAPFWIQEERCVGCGKCENLCPAHAIRMEQGRPVWIKPDCCFCMACLNRCPKEAVQYGAYSQGKFRYYFKGFDCTKYFND